MTFKEVNTRLQDYQPGETASPWSGAPQISPQKSWKIGYILVGVAVTLIVLLAIPMMILAGFTLLNPSFIDKPQRITDKWSYANELRAMVADSVSNNEINTEKLLAQQANSITLVETGEAVIMNDFLLACDLEGESISLEWENNRDTENVIRDMKAFTKTGEEVEIDTMTFFFDLIPANSSGSKRINACQEISVLSVTIIRETIGSGESAQSEHERIVWVSR